MGVEYKWGCLAGEKDLYQYNQQNPNSICGKIKMQNILGSTGLMQRSLDNTLEAHAQNLLLHTMLQRESKFWAEQPNGMIKMTQIHKKRIAKLFPQQKQIQKLLLTLYDIQPQW